jgi:serine/threonine-protein kinase
MADELIAGRYRLLQPLGRGSMSSVWEAEDAELGRRVAVKLLAPSADRQRFEREARAAAALSHPNIVSLYDYGQAEGRPFMVLECLPGGSLEDRLRDGEPLPDADARRIAAEVAAGLTHAHHRGLVHRDLKPANILFDAEGRAKIGDFGIARMRGSGTLTEAGTVLGTASYLSPEQAAGAAAGPASDVYSFGVILFRMLTGRLPFVSGNAMELVRMHRDTAPPAVTDLRADAPAALAAVADAALAKDPAQRPPNGAALLAQLRGDTAIAPAVVGDDTAATQVLRPVRQRRSRAVPAAVAAAIVLGAGVAAAVAVTRGGGSDGPAPSLPGLSLPTVPSLGSTSNASPTTTAATTTTPTTTAPTTTAPTTTAPTTSTVPTTTTTPTTTAPTTTAPTTTAPTTSTVPTTTTTPTTTAGTTTIAPTTT